MTDEHGRGGYFVFITVFGVDSDGILLLSLYFITSFFYIIIMLV